ncbi:hypothetical protein EUGRSUZ_C03946 [Eucalyptus grandis]|uniref:Uncharacterized protein n=2 Tax=Eucalyptus grandis TaxID=71139 RepID=A0ACC3LIU8_EUCGR|nr:hypothetical protein EUGRSUZ_C03946 [Eucalyptus grandis]
MIDRDPDIFSLHSPRGAVITYHGGTRHSVDRGSGRENFGAQLKVIKLIAVADSLPERPTADKSSQTHCKSQTLKYRSLTHKRSFALIGGARSRSLRQVRSRQQVIFSQGTWECQGSLEDIAVEGATVACTCDERGCV